eukprot:5007387-Prymnesium_polylepis.1
MLHRSHRYAAHRRLSQYLALNPSIRVDLSSAQNAGLPQRLKHHLTTAARLAFRSGIGRSLNVTAVVAISSSCEARNSHRALPRCC